MIWWHKIVLKYLFGVFESVLPILFILLRMIMHDKELLRVYDNCWKYYLQKSMRQKENKCVPF